MSDSNAREAVGRAGRRAAYHLLQALVEGLKAVEAVIDELGSIKEVRSDEAEGPTRERIEVE
jgi:hypothetical protein